MTSPAPRALRGIRIVSAALKLEDFPATRQELYFSLGDIEIEAKGGFVPARAALDKVDCDWFENEAEAMNAIKTAARKINRTKVLRSGFRASA